MRFFTKADRMAHASSPQRRLVEVGRTRSQMWTRGAFLISSILLCCSAARGPISARHQQQLSFSSSLSADTVLPRPHPPADAQTLDDHRVLRLFLEEEGQVQRFLNLLKKDFSIDAWSLPRVGPVDVRLSQRSYNASILPLILETGIKTETLVEDLRSLVAEEGRALNAAWNLTWDEVTAAFRQKDPRLPGVCSPEEVQILGDSASREGVYCAASHRRTSRKDRGRRARPVESANPFFRAYRDYPTISKYLDALAAEYPTLATTLSIGRTFNNSTISAVQISSTQYTAQTAEDVQTQGFEIEEAENSQDFADEETWADEKASDIANSTGIHHIQRGSHRRHQRKVFGERLLEDGTFMRRKGRNMKKSAKRHIIISAGQHGREWIAPAVALYIATELVSTYGQEKWVTRLVDAFDWTIIPVVNPDGYQYSHTSDRMWRKNREPTSDPFCMGVDTNRNWDFKWSTNAAVQNPCSDGYAGPRPFSSHESRAVADYILKTAPVAAFIDLHSYSMTWMSPFGGDCDILPSDNEDILECAQGAVKALYKVNRRQFRAGSVCEVSYKTSGLSIDWAYAVGGVKYAYSVGLRDKGKYGFLLPSDQIVPSGEETYTAVLRVARFIMGREKAKPIC